MPWMHKSFKRAQPVPGGRRFLNKKGVGTLTYYLIEALDCQTVNNKQSPRLMI